MSGKVILGMDVHANTCTMVGMLERNGEVVGTWVFPTSEAQIRKHLRQFEGKTTALVIEETSLAQWVSQVAHEHVAEVFISDPRENALISRDANKQDGRDALALCRLYRLGELKRVYHPEEDHRAVFKASVQQYLDLTEQLVQVKNKLKAKFRTWGVLQLEGRRVFSQARRQAFLKEVRQPAIRMQLQRFYALLDVAEQQQRSALDHVRRLGQRYPEIAQFRKLPGVGLLGASVFDAFVQTPQRFERVSQVWRYAKLGVVDRTSDGKRLGYRRLDRAGNGALKAVSYRAWLTAQRGKNEVRTFYERSQQRTGNRVHARLNTQRKILEVMWVLWKHNRPYDPQRFLGSV